EIYESFAVHYSDVVVHSWDCTCGICSELRIFASRTDDSSLRVVSHGTAAHEHHAGQLPTREARHGHGGVRTRHDFRAGDRSDVIRLYRGISQLASAV